MRYILFSIVALFLTTACAEKKEETFVEKPKQLWLDAKANFERFTSQDTIRYYLDLAKQTGFNEVVVDVRQLQGDVLYRSEILKPLTTFGDGFVYERDWDYLQFFIDEARKRDMKITVSAGILPIGFALTQSGPAYDDPERWDDKICIAYTTEGLKSMKEVEPHHVFLNPVLSSVRSFVLDYITEIVTNYDFDSFALDYCRYYGPRYDFSDSSRVAFERFIGEKVERFPEDIFTYNVDGSRVPGKHYQQWWEFRSTNITSLITDIRATIKSIKPDVQLSLWAASWIHSIYQNGQNWTSPDHYDPYSAFHWASPTYKYTGYAPQLDVFLLGSYLDDVFGLDNPESIEYAIARAYNLIGDDCLIYGTVYGENNITNMEDAVYVCLTQSAGLMVFDIVQVIRYNLWDDIKRGIDRAEVELKKSK
ncbi:MAG: family 10 glycosylhydrolase [Dysgonamonadaceae bacterium]|jgi:uncharacterized lipoprotein YddW (UPF0748 family)|nr:family 10 glycosylhydrolase [Dysgonamonadaceae bacterium]